MIKVFVKECKIRTNFISSMQFSRVRKMQNIGDLIRVFVKECKIRANLISNLVF